MKWLLPLWVDEVDLEPAISERMDGAKVTSWGCTKRNEEGRLECLFILQKDDLTPFSSVNMSALAKPPTTWLVPAHDDGRYLNGSFAIPVSCCVEEVRKPMLEIMSHLGQAGTRRIGYVSLCATLQREFRNLPVYVL